MSVIEIRGKQVHYDFKELAKTNPDLALLIEILIAIRKIADHVGVDV